MGGGALHTHAGSNRRDPGANARGLGSIRGRILTGDDVSCESQRG
jgi:hypothetical protein